MANQVILSSFCHTSEICKLNVGEESGNSTFLQVKDKMERRKKRRNKKKEKEEANGTVEELLEQGVVKQCPGCGIGVEKTKGIAMQLLKMQTEHSLQRMQFDSV